MKKEIEDWQLNDYDGQFIPDCFGPDEQEISTNDPKELHFTFRCKNNKKSFCSGFVPIQVILEYLKMNGYQIK